MSHEDILYFEQRAAQERQAAAKAGCTEARRAHLMLASVHGQAAERERMLMFERHPQPAPLRPPPIEPSDLAKQGPEQGEFS